MPEEHLQCFPLWSFGCSIISSCSMWLNPTSAPFLLRPAPKFLSQLLYYSRYSWYLPTSVSQTSPEVLTPSFISALVQTTWTWLLVPTHMATWLSFPHILQDAPLALTSHPCFAYAQRNAVAKITLPHILTLLPKLPRCRGLGRNRTQDKAHGQCCQV